MLYRISKMSLESKNLKLKRKIKIQNGWTERRFGHNLAARHRCTLETWNIQSLSYVLWMLEDS